MYSASVSESYSRSGLPGLSDIPTYKHHRPSVALEHDANRTLHAIHVPTSVWILHVWGLNSSRCISVPTCKCSPSDGQGVLVGLCCIQDLHATAGKAILVDGEADWRTETGRADNRDTGIVARLAKPSARG